MNKGLLESDPLKSRFSVCGLAVQYSPFATTVRSREAEASDRADVFAAADQLPRP